MIDRTSTIRRPFRTSVTLSRFPHSSHRPSFQSTAMNYSKKADPVLDIDGLSAWPSLEAKYVIGGAFPEQRHHLNRFNNSTFSLLVKQKRRGIEQPTFCDSIFH